MKFQKGISGNPAGKPKGAKDKRTALRALIEPQAAALVQKAVDMALAGDTTALRICLERIIPPLKTMDRLVSLDLLGASLADQGRAVLNAVSAANITPGEAATLMQAVAGQARIIEVTELLTRIEALEEKQNANKS
jgi:hypothetical protein